MEQKKDGTQFDYMLMSIQFRIGISNTFVQILRYKKRSLTVSLVRIMEVDS